MAAGLVEGFALVDDRSRFEWVNDFGGRILGHVPADLVGQGSPFRVGAAATAHLRGAEAPSAGQLAAARTGDGDLDLEYRVVRVGPRKWAVSFRNSASVHELAAIARAASSVANSGSLETTLTALAEAVYAAVDLAAVQVLTLHDEKPLLRVVGRAGFAAGTRDYGDRLEECRRLGADMHMVQAAREQRPIVTLHRKASVMADPRWAPMHEFFGPLDWDGFAAVPLVVRDATVGMLVVFYPTGRHPDAQGLDFLTAIADQAAMAVDYASLLAECKDRVRRDERQRIARDLHDSVVQHVFSMRLQARALHDHCGSTGAAGTAPDTERVASGVAQLMTLSQHALADLRDLMFELRPDDIAEHGLAEAIRVHADAIKSRSGILVDVDCPQTPVELAPEAQEDVYRIVQEALHDLVQYAGTNMATVRVHMEPAEKGCVVVEVACDGRGNAPAGPPAGGLGLSSMQDRVGKWGGDVRVHTTPGRGARVRLALPLQRPDAVPARSGGGPLS